MSNTTSWFSNGPIVCLWCVDAVLRLLGVFHDVLYGDVAPVRPGSTLGVVSVRLSRSLFVPGRQLKKGGSPPFPPALGSHTRVATKRRVGFRSPASHTRVATARAERDAPTPMFFFFFFFFCVFFVYFFFFFLGGGGGGKGSVGL